MRRLLFIIPVVLFLGLAGYFGLALTRDPSTLPSALIDKPAPAFTLGGLGDKPALARDDFAGKVVLVNFFASWCVPCRAEHPILMRMAEQEKLTLYGIAYKDRPEDAQRFLSQLGDPFGRIGLDQSGRVGIDFGVYGVPETYVIDKTGHIRLRHVGPLTASDLQNEILPLLKRLGSS